MRIKIVLLMLFIMRDCVAGVASPQSFVSQNQNYIFHIKETGINYNFQFEENIKSLTLRKKAGLHVLKAVYGDTSIQNNFSKAYKKERALCYALDSRFYTYTLCFFPDDFSKNRGNKLLGFVTRVPNWMWQFTHVFLPLGIAFSLIFFYRGSKKEG